MNNKAINEFAFCRIWRIKQISEGVIHLGLRLRYVCMFVKSTVSYAITMKAMNIKM